MHITNHKLIKSRRLHGLLIFSLLTLGSCNKTTKKQNSIIKVVGESSNSLKNGWWSIKKEGKVVKEGSFKDGLKVGVWKYYINENSSPLQIDWNVHKDKTQKLNYPKKWTLLNKQDYLFTAMPIKDDFNQFFIILRHDKVKYKMTVIEYIKEVYNQMIANSKEQFLKYKVEELVFKEKNRYYAKYIIKKNDINYVIHNLYTDDEDYIYDISFKGNLKDDQLNYMILGDIISNYYIDNKRLINDDDRIIKINKIRLDSL